MGSELVEGDGCLESGEVRAEAEWGPPPPSATCGFVVRPTSSSSGRSNTCPSRLADAAHSRTASPARISAPPISTVSSAWRPSQRTIVAQRRTSSTRRFAGTSPSTKRRRCSGCSSSATTPWEMAAGSSRCRRRRGAARTGSARCRSGAGRRAPPPRGGRGRRRPGAPADAAQPAPCRAGRAGASEDLHLGRYSGSSLGTIAFDHRRMSASSASGTPTISEIAPAGSRPPRR